MQILRLLLYFVMNRAVFAVLLFSRLTFSQKNLYFVLLDIWKKKLILVPVAPLIFKSILIQAIVTLVFVFEAYLYVKFYDC